MDFCKEFNGEHRAFSCPAATNLTVDLFSCSSHVPLDPRDTNTGLHYDPARPDLLLRYQVASDGVLDPSGSRHRNGLRRGREARGSDRRHPEHEARLRDRQDQAGRRSHAPLVTRSPGSERRGQLQECRSGCRALIRATSCIIVTIAQTRFLSLAAVPERRSLRRAGFGFPLAPPDARPSPLGLLSRRSVINVQGDASCYITAIAAASARQRKRRKQLTSGTRFKLRSMFRIYCWGVWNVNQLHARRLQPPPALDAVFAEKSGDQLTEGSEHRQTVR